MDIITVLIEAGMTDAVDLADCAGRILAQYARGGLSDKNVRSLTNVLDPNPQDSDRPEIMERLERMPQAQKDFLAALVTYIQWLGTAEGRVNAKPDSADSAKPTEPDPDAVNAGPMLVKKSQGA